MARSWIIITLCASSFCFTKANFAPYGYLWDWELEAPIVKFSNTTVEGVQRETFGKRNIDAFIGIPYAEPPIGDLRFRNPVPYVYRDATFLAKERKNLCLQKVHGHIKGDEDCLYLDVYRPRSTGNQSLPVMVYFQTADITPKYDIPEIGGYYLLDKDIVLVTFTYRLGIFGFFSSGDDQVPGNFGLKDQKVALQWVQSNIAAFGGNPNRVTIFGNGHGAESIHYHTLVNHTEGLFHQYILQSGTALGPWSVCGRRIYENRAAQVADDMGCPIIPTWKLAYCLRQADPMRIMLSSVSRFKDLDIGLLKMWTPTKEPVGPDAFLTECPKDLFNRNQQRNLPFIAGFVQEEMMGAIAAIDSGRGKDWCKKPVREIRQVVEMISGSPDLLERVNQFYFRGVLYNETSLFPPELIADGHLQMFVDYCIHITKFYSNLIRDIYYYHPIVRVLEQQRQNSIYPFYFYYFDFRGVCTLNNLYGNWNEGASHGDDLLFLFPYTPSRCPRLDSDASLAERDVLTVKAMVELWTSFATQGVPRSSRVDDWPPYDSEGHYLEIGFDDDPKITLKSKFLPERMKWWGNFSFQTCD